MHELAVILKLSLVGFGALFLALALVPLRNVSSLFPVGRLKLKWDVLSTLVLAFIGGYLFYAYEYWVYHSPTDGFELVVPLIFFFGGIFVFLVGRLASQSARDIKRITLLQHQSITDPLMNISNRRHFDKRLEEERHIALRYKLPLSLLLIDVDRFKDVNDNYGHLVGDEILRNLAKLIKDIARESDIICRYGGEEIAIIAPSTQSDKAENFANRVRSAIEANTIELHCARQKKLTITVSIGVTSLDLEKSQSLESFVGKADEALYQAKEAGRNRVVLI